MRTAIKDALGFHAMPDHAAAAMRTRWRKGVNGTFETVEYVHLPTHVYCKALIVHVAAYFTSPAFLIPHLALSCVHHLPRSPIHKSS
jgi:hypothetical protein